MKKEKPRERERERERHGVVDLCGDGTLQTLFGMKDCTAQYEYSFGVGQKGRVDSRRNVSVQMMKAI